MLPWWQVLTLHLSASEHAKVTATLCAAAVTLRGREVSELHLILLDASSVAWAREATEDDRKTNHGEDNNISSKAILIILPVI